MTRIENLTTRLKPGYWAEKRRQSVLQAEGERAKLALDIILHDLSMSGAIVIPAPKGLVVEGDNFMLVQKRRLETGQLSDYVHVEECDGLWSVSVTLPQKLININDVVISMSPVTRLDYKKEKVIATQCNVGTRRPHGFHTTYNIVQPQYIFDSSQVFSYQIVKGGERVKLGQYDFDCKEDALEHRNAMCEKATLYIMNYSSQTNGGNKPESGKRHFAYS